MQPTKYIWHNGAFTPWHSAKTHILTHTLHYGAGVFEGIRFYQTLKGPAVFRLPEHIERLFRSAEIFDMNIPYSQRKLQDAVVDTIRKNAISAGYIRPIAYFGYGTMGLATTDKAPVEVAIAVWPWGKYLGDTAISVKTSSYIRIHPKSTHAEAKITGHYVNSILATREVKKKGYQEALLLDYKGFIAEGPGENFFIVKDGVLYTPPLGNILPGITRDSVIAIAQNRGIKAEEKKLTLQEAYAADEAFFTGTAAEVTLIASLDGHSFRAQGEKSVATLLKEEYASAVTGGNPRYERWLTRVNPN